MGYSIHSDKVRLIGPTGKVFRPFEADIYCDPCAHSSQRYRISGYTANNMEMVEPWYRVIHPDDSYKTVLCKVRITKAIAEAEQAVMDAQNNLRRVRGY